MGWFSRKPLRMEAVRDGARVVRDAQRQETNVYSLRLAIRAQLVSNGYKTDEIEQAINYLLK